MVSALFDITTQNDDEANVEYRARFYRQHPMLNFPEDWDQLPIDEKK